MEVVPAVMPFGLRRRPSSGCTRRLRGHCAAAGEPQIVSQTRTIGDTTSGRVPFQAELILNLGMTNPMQGPSSHE
jgi:hypothetical protein